MKRRMEGVGHAGFEARSVKNHIVFFADVFFLGKQKEGFEVKLLPNLQGFGKCWASA